jgi:hypothetical protein
MTLADPTRRKSVELDLKLNALDAEFERWTAASVAGAPFQKHHTQILALKERLEGHRAQIKLILDGDKGLSTAREMSRMLLALHRIWEFFRSKLAQRFEAAFENHLQIADEFAWLCYKPVYEKAFAAIPNRPFLEPPLVFLNGGSSPFILTRDASFQAEPVPRELIQDKNLQKTMARLPFPVIGIPWHQIVQLPEALAIGHEVGHSIEADLNLETTLDSFITGGLAVSKGANRATYWHAWRSEVFADVCGCLGGGPAFASALADFLLSDPAETLSSAPANDSYPPANLRVRFNAIILDEMGLTSEAREFLEYWQPFFPLLPDHQPYLKDAREILTRFVLFPLKELGDAPLSSVLTFTRQQQTKAEEQASLARAGRQLRDYKDLRLTLAAARLAYEGYPTAFSQPAPVGPPSPSDRLRKKLSSLLTSDLRSGERLRSSQEQSNIDQRNRDNGQAEFAELRRILGAPK